MNLKDFLQYLLNGIDPSKIRDMVDTLLNNEGEQAAAAVVAKLYNENGAHAAADFPASDPKLLARASFYEFRHFLRKGSDDKTGDALTYPGAPECPAIEAGADIVYAIGDARTLIQGWCNAATAAFYAALTPTPTTPTAS